MGGLVALHLALRRPDRVAGLVLLAPAVNFTDRRWERLSLDQRQTLFNGGAISLETEYKEDWVDLDFYRVAREQYGLPTTTDSVPIHCPVRILHGGLDSVVPLHISQALIDQIQGDDVTLTVVKKGEHKLVEPRDLDLMNSIVAQLLLQLERQGQPGAGAGGGEGPRPDRTEPVAAPAAASNKGDAVSGVPRVEVTAG